MVKSMSKKRQRHIRRSFRCYFQLTAKEDIYSLDGRNKLIYKKGEAVSMDISENGYYVTNELGEIHISGLPLGKYELKEVQELEGYVKNNKSMTLT